MIPAVTGLNVSVDIGNAAGIASASTTFPAGTQCRIAFRFGPEFTLTKTGGGNVFNFTSSHVVSSAGDGPGGGGPPVATQITYSGDTLTFPAPIENKNVVLQAITPQEFTTTTQLASFLQTQIENLDSFILDYQLNDVPCDNTGAPSNSGLSNPEPGNLKIRVRWRFDEGTSTGDTIVFTPRIESMKLIGVSGLHFTTTLTTIQNLLFPGGTQDNGLTIDTVAGNNQNEHTFASITNDITPLRQTRINATSAALTFKHSETHAFGIVFLISLVDLDLLTS